jgi:hypothetical protein
MPPVAKMPGCFQCRGAISEADVFEVLKPHAEINSMSAERQCTESLINGLFTTR